MTVFERIKTLWEQFTPIQKRIGEFILSDYKRSAFLNSTDLALQVGASNPTVIRFARALGYSGYKEFQTELQNAVQSELSALERRSYLPVDPDQESDVFSLEAENLRMISEKLDRDALQQAIAMLDSARTVFVYGKQISESVASFAAYTLGKIQCSVRQVDQWSLGDEAAYQADPAGCCALVIALPRYPTATINFLHFLHERGIPAIVITGEGSTFPEKEKVSVLLSAPVRYISFIDTIASVFCLINSLAIGLIRCKGPNEIEALTAFENYVTECHIYVSNSDRK